MPRLHLSALCASTVLFSVGCGGARVVHVSQAGGVIALEGDRNKAVEQAHQIMADHCGGPYKVLEEGEQVGEAELAPTVDDSAESISDGSEWRMRYMCGSGPAVAPGPDQDVPAVESAGTTTGAAGGGTASGR
jgi:hypothetical protein